MVDETKKSADGADKKGSSEGGSRSNALTSELIQQMQDAEVDRRFAAKRESESSYDDDNRADSKPAEATKNRSQSDDPVTVAENRHALNTGPWKEQPDSASTKESGQKPASTAADQPPRGQAAAGVLASEFGATGASLLHKPSGSAGDSNLQPPPNVISTPPGGGNRPFDQSPHSAPSAPSAPSSKSELTPPPLEKGASTNSGPISGPPPVIAQKAPDVVPGSVVGDQPGSNRLIGQVVYGPPQQEKQLDNRQGVPLDSNAAREQPRDKSVQSGDQRNHSDVAVVKSDGVRQGRVPDSPHGTPHAEPSASGRGLLIIGRKEKEQLQQDIQKYGEQEAAKRFQEARQQAALKAESSATKVDTAKPDVDAARTAKGEQVADSSKAKTESSSASVDGKGTKPDTVPNDSKGTRTEIGDAKGPRPEGQTPESKASKGDTGTRPGDHAPAGGKIAETNPEGTRSGDIDKSGKVAEASTGSKGGDSGSGTKSGDGSSHKGSDSKSPDSKSPDGKSPDTNKGPEIGLVGKVGEPGVKAAEPGGKTTEPGVKAAEPGGKSTDTGGKSFEPIDKTQDGKASNVSDKRGSADNKGPSGQGQGQGGDRGGGLGSGWKGEQGSRSGQQGQSKGDQGRVPGAADSSKTGDTPTKSSFGIRPVKESTEPASDPSGRKGSQPVGTSDVSIKGNVQTDGGSSKSGTKGGVDQKGNDQKSGDQKSGDQKASDQKSGDQKSNPDQKIGSDKTSNTDSKPASDRKPSVKDDSKTEVSPSAKGLRPNPPPEGKVAEAPPANQRREPIKQNDAKDDSRPPRKQDGDIGLIPAIKGGIGAGGLSIPDWLVRGVSKKVGQDSVGKDKGKDPSNPTQKTKAVRDDNQAATAKLPPVTEGKDRGDKPRVDLLLPGKSRKDPNAFVSEQGTKNSDKDTKPSSKDSRQSKDDGAERSSKERSEQTPRPDNKDDTVLNQRGRKVPMQLAGRETEPLPAIGKIPKSQEKIPNKTADKTPERTPEKTPERLVEKRSEKQAQMPNENAPEKTQPAAGSLGNRDAVMALLLGKGKATDSEKAELKKDSKPDSEEKSDADSKVSTVPKGTIFGVLGGAKKLTRNWQATESGTFKLNSSDSVKALKSGDLLPSERLTQSEKAPRQINWIRDQYSARQEQQSKQRRTYIAQEGDHLGLVAVKTVGRTSPEIERLFLQLNPHLEMRRTFSEAHNNDVSFLEAGSILSLPTWDEIQNVP